MLPPLDRDWRRLVPDWSGVLGLTRAGVPFHLVADRRYDRSGDPRRVARALASGATLYLPQAHEVLPRVARLIVAIRALVMGPLREECSFLFAVEGRGREGMGLHHDGDVHGFWVQLEGRRTVTIGPPVNRRAPADLPASLAEPGGEGWHTLDLSPGSLFHLPPFTPHRVLCHGRSLALSLTWGAPRRRAGARARAEALAAWPVASGRAIAIPPASRDRWWTQAPMVPAPGGRAVLTPEGAIALPAAAMALAVRLGAMPTIDHRALDAKTARAADVLGALGLLDARDLPLAILPAEPRALDGWSFS